MMLSQLLLAIGVVVPLMAALPGAPFACRPNALD